MIIGFFFTLIIIRPDLEFQIGTLLALLSALTHAIAGLLVKKLSETEDIITLMFSMVVLMTLLLFFRLSLSGKHLAIFQKFLY